MSAGKKVKYNEGLIKTKCSRPEANRYLIPRSRLYKKLDKSLQRKLTLVTAPAGFGKSTAILDWLDRRDLKAAWLSIDSVDNNPMTFWRYICAALDGIATGIFQDTDYVFQLIELLNANIHLSILIDRLMEVEVDFLLILDDVHLIANPVILDGISYLIGYLPPKMHLVLIGRFEPKLKPAMLGIKIQILRIGERDLRFQNEEIYRFYRTRGHTLENEDIQKLENYTEGWAAALVAVAMSMEDESDGNGVVQALGSSGKSIYRYLEEEVLGSWPEEKRSFALKTSLLDTLSAPLCDAVTGENNGSLMLKEINARNGFLISLDYEEYEYRYHHLFRDFLYKLLLKSNRTVVPDLHARAAAWYREQGADYQAIEHYLNGIKYDAALELIKQHIDDLVIRNDFATAFSWIDRLPGEYRDSSFRISKVYALYHAEMGNLQLAREWLAKLELLAKDKKYTGGPALKGYTSTSCRLVKANLLIREGNVREFFSSIRKAVKTNEGRYFKLSEYMDVNTSDIYFYRCPYNKFTYLFAEKRDEYWEMVKNYRKMISENPGYAPLAAGEYLYENNRLDEALPYLLEALEEAQSANCPGALVPVMVNIARLKRARLDMKGALETPVECEKMLNSPKLHWYYLVHAFRARLQIDAGDMDGVERWFNSCKINIYMEISRIREFELLVYARVLMLKGRFTDAELLLKKILIFAEKTIRRHSRVEALNLLAMLAYQKKEMKTAMDYLEKSLYIGMKESYIRSYTDEFDSVIPLLRHYVMHRRKQKGHRATKNSITYAKDLLKQTQKSLVLEQAAQSAASAGEIKKLLTDQEKKVLALLLEAYANKEIAQELGISIWTVKSHIGHIYGKLAVKSRAQCIKLAREMHLLD